jgi:multidrug efflux pump subunit AcrA (membrane-fusion protein)
MIKNFFPYSLITVLVVSCGTKHEKTKPIKETITESVYASGIVKRKNQYKVFSLVNGLIDRILVAEGDFRELTFKKYFWSLL